jgi:MFS family permease
MLGIEAVPAVLYYLGLFFVPRSPRWLVLKGKVAEAKAIMARLTSKEEAEEALQSILDNNEKTSDYSGKFKDLFQKKLKLVLTIGIVLAILQQITGINSVFFYAPMIFEQAGIGTDASFVQAIFVGLINLVFTLLAILFIDKLGRKPLLAFGVAGIAICMFTISYEFNSATYQLNQEKIVAMELPIQAEVLAPILNSQFQNEEDFAIAMEEALSPQIWQENKTDLLKSSIQLNPILILIAILGFVASFAISIGPVMWVLFSELFPNQIRGVAISAVGLINSAVSFVVQWVFPWELEYLGSDVTFLLYGIFAALGFVFIVKVIPETKGKSLEEIEAQLVI